MRMNMTKMLFSSDRIRLWADFTGQEPKEVLRWWRSIEHDQYSRVVVAINTYYPEVQGGYYENRLLMAVAQDALAKCDLFVVIADVYRDLGAVPIELPGTLQLNEDYTLMDSKKAKRGQLSVWKLSAGGGGAYNDAIIMDLAVPKEAGGRFAAAIRELCAMHRILVEDVSIHSNSRM